MLKDKRYEKRNNIFEALLNNLIEIWQQDIFRFVPFNAFFVVKC